MGLRKKEKQQKKIAAKSWQVHRDYGAKLQVWTIFIGLEISIDKFHFTFWAFPMST